MTAAECTDNTAAQTFIALNVAELRRLVEEANTRLSAAEYLPALASIQAIQGRINDLGELCSHEVRMLTTPEVRRDLEADPSRPGCYL